MLIRTEDYDENTQMLDTPKAKSVDHHHHHHSRFSRLGVVPAKQRFQLRLYLTVVAILLVIDISQRQAGGSFLFGKLGQYRSSRLCTDGTTPGYWTPDYKEWVTNDCVYKNYTKKDVKQCLDDKTVHIFGDSTSRHLYERFIQTFGPCKTPIGDVLQNNDTKYDQGTSCTLNIDNANVKLTYQFRGKIMHQPYPRANKTEEDDVHNGYFTSGAKPDILIMGIGPHEAIGWTGRPDPKRNLTKLAEDTDEFLEFLSKHFNGTLVWWKTHFLKPGKVKGSQYNSIRVFYDDAVDLMTEKLRAYGAKMADFYQTTKFPPSDGAGVHYEILAALHNNILLNVICNTQ